MPTVRQPSFAGGEFAPTLWARTEFEKYAVGARRLRNMIVNPYGAAMNRAGFRYVAETKASGKAKLVSFTFSETDTFLLAFGAGWLRFYTLDSGGNPGAVESSPGVPYEIATPYAEADLPYLRYSQVGDVITLVCKGHTPRELTRTVASPLTFTLTTISFDVPTPGWGTGYVWTQDIHAADATHLAKQWRWKFTEIRKFPDGSVVETGPNDIALVLHYGVTTIWDTGVTYALGAEVSANDYENKKWVSLQAGNVGHALPSSTDAWWDGPQSRTPPYSYTTALPDTLVVYPDKTVRLRFPSYGLVVYPGYEVIARRIYRGRGELFGYVGEATGGEFIDVGDDPDWALAPPKGTNPFAVFDENGALVRTETPSVVAHFDGRRIFARTAERPAFIFASSLGAYDNFDEHSILTADDAIVRELASMRWEEIRALVPGGALLALTSSAEWVVSGGQENLPITPTGNFSARPRTKRGSSWVEPVELDDEVVLFVPPSGNLVRAFQLDGGAGRYRARDITITARHLFAGKQILDLAWCEEPFSLAWSVLDDGLLCSLTFIEEHKLEAWSWHDTQGAFEDTCAVRELGEDHLYAVVRRTVGGATKRYIERQDSRTVSDVREGLFLDSALTYRGTPATHFSGLGHLEGLEVYALADGQVAGPFTVTAGAIDLSADDFPDGASIVHVGLSYDAEIETLDVGPGSGKSLVKAVKWVAIEYEGALGGEVGETFDGTLEEIRPKTVEEGFDPAEIANETHRIPIESQWNTGGRVVIRQSAPLPVAILAVTREVEYGG